MIRLHLNYINSIRLVVLPVKSMNTILFPNISVQPLLIYIFFLTELILNFQPICTPHLYIEYMYILQVQIFVCIIIYPNYFILLLLNLIFNQIVQQWLIVVTLLLILFPIGNEDLYFTQFEGKIIIFVRKQRPGIWMFNQEMEN